MDCCRLRRLVLNPKVFLLLNLALAFYNVGTMAETPVLGPYARGPLVARQYRPHLVLPRQLTALGRRRNSPLPDALDRPQCAPGREQSRTHRPTSRTDLHRGCRRRVSRVAKHICVESDCGSNQLWVGTAHARWEPLVCASANRCDGNARPGDAHRKSSRI